MNRALWSRLLPPPCCLLSPCGCRLCVHLACGTSCVHLAWGAAICDTVATFECCWWVQRSEAPRRPERDLAEPGGLRSAKLSPLSRAAFDVNKLSSRYYALISGSEACELSHCCSQDHLIPCYVVVPAVAIPSQSCPALRKGWVRRQGNLF